MNNSAQEQMKDAVGFYQKQKFSFIPIVAGRKNPLIDWTEHQRRLPNAGELGEWWDKFWSQGAGIAIVCGKVSGIFAIDVDTGEGEKWIAGLNLPRTCLSNTPHGTHYIFKHPGYPIPNAVSLAPGIDIRGDGGYIVAPPSHNGNGQRYIWVVSPETVIAECPEEVLELLQQKENKVQSGDKPHWISAALQQGVGKGQRNGMCAKLAGYFRNLQPKEVTEQILLGWNAKNNPPLPESEILTTIASVYKYPPKPGIYLGLSNINYDYTYTKPDFVSKSSTNRLLEEDSEGEHIPARLIDTQRLQTVYKPSTNRLQTGVM